MSIEVSGPPPDMAITNAIRQAILAEMPESDVEVTGGGGHFSIRVNSSLFEGKGLVDQQRMVYRAITTLMAGDEAPVHAIDQLICETP